MLGAACPYRSYDAMPDLHTFVIFAAASAVFLAVPGPSVIYIVSRSLAEGRTAGIVSALGIQTGGLVHVLAATIGVSALLASSAVAFSVVKYAGAAYLIYLGIRKLLEGAEPVARRARSPGASGCTGRACGQHPQPEDRAVLPRLPAAVRRPRARGGGAAGARARRALPRARDAERLDLRARGRQRPRLAGRAPPALARVSGCSYVGLGVLAALSPSSSSSAHELMQ